MNNDNNNWKHLSCRSELCDVKVYGDYKKTFKMNSSKKSIKQKQTYSNNGNLLKTGLHINKDICNNCGKYGHLFRNCKNPIVSFGCIQFRINNNVREYLMICRKDTLGYIDFIRGKYNLQDESYIINMFKQMTNIEKKISLMENLKHYGIIYGKTHKLLLYTKQKKKHLTQSFINSKKIDCNSLLIDRKSVV